MEYKQSEVVAQKRHRFGGITVTIPVGQAPTISCREQEAMTFGDSTLVRDAGELNFVFNGAEEFPLIDPNTNQPTGTVLNGSQIYYAVYSYVMHEAKKRDIADLVRIEDEAKAAQKAIDDEAAYQDKIRQAIADDAAAAARAESVAQAEEVPFVDIAPIPKE